MASWLITSKTRTYTAICARYHKHEIDKKRELENKNKKKERKLFTPALQLGRLERTQLLGCRRVRLGNALLNLLLAVHDAVLGGLLFNLLLREFGKLAGGAHIRHLLEVALGEDQVDFLERATGGLGVEEPHDGDEKAVPGGEEEVGAPFDAGDHDRGDHDDGEVEEPVGAGGDGVGLRTGLDGRQLGGVEPGQGQPGGAKDAHVQEEAEDGTLGGLGVTGDQAAEDNDHGGALAKGAAQEEVATTDLLDEEPGEGGEDGVANHVDTTDQEGKVVRLADGVLEQNGQIVDDSVATGDLLEELRRGADNHATEVLRGATGEKVGEGGLLSAGPSLVSTSLFRIG